MKSLLKKILFAFRAPDPSVQDLVGIDLSHNYIRCVQLSKHGKIWSITNLISKKIDASVENDDQDLRLISKTLKNIILEKKFDTNYAAISLPISAAIVQIVQIPILGDEELKTAVENGSLWENVITVTGDLSEYSIFWQIIKKFNDKNQMAILFVASKIEDIERYCDLVRESGFEPLIVDVRCFALRNILKIYSEDLVTKQSAFLEISG